MTIVPDGGHIAVDALHVYVAGYDAIQVYDLPLSANEQPALTMPLNGPASGIPVDIKHIYVSSSRLNTVWEYSLPLKANQTFSAALSAPNPQGVAILP